MQRHTTLNRCATENDDNTFLVLNTKLGNQRDTIDVKITVVYSNIYVMFFVFLSGGL